METIDNKVKILKRIEFGKQEFKGKYQNILNSMGVFEVETNEYQELQTIIKMCHLYFKKHNIMEFDINQLPSKLKAMLITKYYQAVNNRINTLSEESKIFFMIDTKSKTFKVDDKTEIKQIDEVCKKWSEYIILGIISGYMGKGKTDFSLKIAEWFYKAGAVDYIISNIGLSGSSIYDNVYYEISTLSELLIFMYENKDKNKIFIFDEAGIHVSHRRAMKSNNILLMNLSKLIRKLKCHMFLITQDSKGVDKALRELATLYIHKDTKTTAQITECMGEREIYNIAGITATNINYDTNDMADFVFDLTVDDMTEVMKLISSNPSVSTFKNEIDKMVEKNKDTKNNSISDTHKQYEYINDDTQDEKNAQDNIIYQSKNNTQDDTIQNIILRYIYNTGGASARDIADAIKKSKPRTNAYLKELKENCLIYPEGTGKKIMYILTDAGKYCISQL